MEDFAKGFRKISHLNGLKFIKTLLDYEKKRFDKMFSKGSVYEQINRDFGIFPEVKSYPVYFSGNITKPADKYVFVGINPGYVPEQNESEQKYLEDRGLLNGYSNIFKDYFPKVKKSLISYYADVCKFLKQVYGGEHIEPTWPWLHENLIALELIPYHSSSAAGLRINDEEYFKDTYFKALTKILDYLEPSRPVLINGFSRFANHFSDKCFEEVISFNREHDIWKGWVLGGKRKIKFIGLPFLSWQLGRERNQAIVAQAKKAVE